MMVQHGAVDREAKRAAQRIDRLRKATHIPAAEYTDPCIWEDCPDDVRDVNTTGDGFFLSVQRLRRAIERTFSEEPLAGLIEPPVWVWACSPMHLSLDAESIVQDAIDNGGYPEEAEQHISKERGEALQALIDEWCKSLPRLGWETDHSRVVVLNPAAFAELIAEAP